MSRTRITPSFARSTPAGTSAQWQATSTWERATEVTETWPRQRCSTYPGVLPSMHREIFTSRITATSASEKSRPANSGYPGHRSQSTGGVLDGDVRQGLVQQLIGNFAKRNGSGNAASSLSFQIGIKIVQNAIAGKSDIPVCRLRQTALESGDIVGNRGSNFVVETAIQRSPPIAQFRLPWGWRRGAPALPFPLTGWERPQSVRIPRFNFHAVMLSGASQQAPMPAWREPWVQSGLPGSPVSRFSARAGDVNTH